MRVAIVVCGANGERGQIIERAVEIFAKGNNDKILQFSACTVIGSPIIIEMSGGKSEHSVAVNGCRNKCSEIIMRKAGLEPKVSIVLDDSLDRVPGKCENCTHFIFPDIREEECAKFAQKMAEALQAAQ